MARMTNRASAHALLAVALSLLTAAPALAQTGTAPQVRVMPDQQTYTGQKLIMWADIYLPNFAANAPLFFTWDFGDGTASAHASFTDSTNFTSATNDANGNPWALYNESVSNLGNTGKKILEVTHTFPTSVIGKLYATTLTVSDNLNNVVFKTCYIQVGDVNDYQVRAGVARQQLLRRLYTTRYWRGTNHGFPMYGMYNEGDVEASGMALLAMCNNGFTATGLTASDYLPNGDATRHPYVDFSKGLTYWMLDRLYNNTIWCTPNNYVGGCDMNGNGYGLYYYDGAGTAMTYKTGITTMGLIGTLNPTMDVSVWGFPGQNHSPWTVKDVVQDVCDGVAACNGVRGNGGCWYQFDGYSYYGQGEGSTNQWPVIIWQEATLPENGFNCTVNSYSVGRMANWESFGVHETGDGGFGYTAQSGNNYALTGGGIVGCSVVWRYGGYDRSDNINRALSYEGNNYTYSLYDFYSIFSFVKGMRVSGHTTLPTSNYSPLTNLGYQWYPDHAQRITDGMMSSGVASIGGNGVSGNTYSFGTVQAGTWPSAKTITTGNTNYIDASGGLGDESMRTAAAVLVLTPSVVGLPPVANAKGSTTDQSGNRLIMPGYQVFTLDASLSSTPDTNKSIAYFEWSVDGLGFPASTPTPATVAVSNNTIYGTTAFGPYSKGGYVCTKAPTIRFAYPIDGSGNPLDRNGNQLPIGSPITVTLRVSDNASPPLQGSDTITITLTNAFNVAPNPVIKGPAAGTTFHIYDTVTFDPGTFSSDLTTSGTYDPNYARDYQAFVAGTGLVNNLPSYVTTADVKLIEWDVDGSLTYPWKFDVTTSASGVRTLTGRASNPDGGASSIPTKVYTTAGDYTITLRVTDSGSSGAIWTTGNQNPTAQTPGTLLSGTIGEVIHVINTPPSAGVISAPDVVFSVGSNGAQIPVQATGFVDPQGLPLTYHWSWTGSGGNKDTLSLGRTRPVSGTNFDTSTTLGKPGGANDTGSSANDVPVSVGIGSNSDRIITVVADNGAGALSTPVSKHISVTSDPSVPGVYGPTKVLVNSVNTYTDGSVLFSGVTPTNAWSVNGGTIQSGQGTTSISWKAPASTGTFTITLTDNDGAPHTANLTVTVVSSAPTAAAPTGFGPLTRTTNENISFPISLDNNNTDGSSASANSPDGSPVSFFRANGTTPLDGLTTTAGGTVHLFGNVVRYDPPLNYYNINFNGTDVTTGVYDTFQYIPKNSAGTAQTSPAVPITITIKVQHVNQAPKATGFTNGTAVVEDGTIDIDLAGHVVDPDGDSITYQIPGVSGGTAALLADGHTVHVVPTALSRIAMTIQFRGTDTSGAVGSAAILTVNISPINHAPTATSQQSTGAVSTNEDSPVDITLGGADPDGDAITAVQILSKSSGGVALSTLNGGTLVQKSGNVYTYTPPLHYFQNRSGYQTGNDSFVFKMQDNSSVAAGAGTNAVATSFATIEVNVIKIPFPPVVNPIAIGTPTPVLGNANGVTSHSTTPNLIPLLDSGASDLNGEKVTVYFWNAGPAGSDGKTGSFTLATTTTASFTWKLGPALAGDPSLLANVMFNDGPTPPPSKTDTVYVQAVNEDGKFSAVQAITVGFLYNTPAYFVTNGATHTVSMNVQPVNANAANPNVDNPTDPSLRTAGFSATVTLPENGSGTINLVGGTATGLTTTDAILMKDRETATTGISLAVDYGQTAAALNVGFVNSNTVTISPTQYFNTSQPASSPQIRVVASDPLSPFYKTPLLISVIVSPVNQVPSAANASFTVNQDTAVSGTLVGSDVHNLPLTFSVVEAGSVHITGTSNGVQTATTAHGTISLTTGPGAGKGNFTFTPSLRYRGADSFTFTVTNDDSAVTSTNAHLTSAAATVSMSFLPVFSTPSATGAGPFAVVENAANPLTGSLGGSDLNNDPITFALVQAPNNGGSVSINASTGAFSYTAGANKFGTETFTYKVSNAQFSSSAATVTINVGHVNQAPSLIGQSIGAAEDSSGTQFTLGATDPDPGTLYTATLLTAPLHGSVTAKAGDTTNLVWIYKPTPNAFYSGADSFTMKVNDQASLNGSINVADQAPAPTTTNPKDSGVATFSVTITHTPHNPTANNLTITTTQNTSTSGTLTGSDQDGNPITFTLDTTSGAHGTISLNAATGAFTYTPDTNFNDNVASASFTFHTTDTVSSLASASSGTVTLHVTPVVQPPTAANLSITVQGDTGTVTAGQAILAGQEVSNANPARTLTFALSTGGTTGRSAHGQVTLGSPVAGSNGNFTCSFTYVPDSLYNGPDSFQFTTNNGTGGFTSSAATVSISVSPVQHVPTASIAAIAATTDASASNGAFVTLDGSASNSPDGRPLTYAWTVNGTLQSASGVKPSLFLPLGSVTVGLVVSDDRTPAKVSTQATVSTNVVPNRDLSKAVMTITGGNNQSGTVGKAVTTALAVRVKDSFGNVMSGVSVAWTFPSGGGVGTTPTNTNASGDASTTATYGSAAGSQSFTASVTGGPSASFTLSAAADAATASIVASSGSGQSAVINNPLTNPLSVTVKDSFGNPVQGVNVSFQALSTGASVGAGTVATDASGFASTSATLGSAAGSQSFKATLGASTANYTATASVDTGADATLTIVDGDSQTGTVATVLAKNIKVQLFDKQTPPNPLPNVTLNFTAPAIPGAGFPASIASTTTDSNGMASMPVTLGQIAGPQAFVVQESAHASTQVTFHMTAKAEVDATTAKIQIVSGDAQAAATVGTQLGQALVVSTTDRFNNAVGGIPVLFTSSTGTVSPSTQQNTNTTTFQTSVLATLGTAAGPHAFTATVVGTTVASSVTFHETGVADTTAATAQIAISAGLTDAATSGIVGQQLTGTLVAIVSDANGNPVGGVPVSFSIPSGAKVAVNGNSFTSTPAGVSLSDGTGQVRCQLQLGTGAGAQDFTLQVNGGAKGKDTFHASATADATAATAVLSIVSGDTQSGTVSQSVQPLVVKVVDQFGNVLNGMQIDFSSASGGLFGALSQASVNANTGVNGQLSMPVKLGNGAGAQTFTATLHGTAQAQTFHATASADGSLASALISITAGENQAGTVGKTLATQLSVKVTDAFGNVLSGVSVAFSSGETFLPAALQPTAAQNRSTNASGIASTLSTRLGNEAGAQVLTASVVGGSASVTFHASAAADTAAATAQIVLATGTPQSGVAGQALGTALGATVEDQFGNPVGGVAVHFAALEGGTLSNAANGSFGSSVDLTSDASGKVVGFGRFSQTAHGQKNGFQATVTNSTSANASVFYQTTVLADTSAATAIVIKVSGENQASAIVAQNLPAPIVVKVTDQYGNPIQNANVTALLPAGASPSTKTGDTDSSGQVSLVCQLGSTAGAQTITVNLTANLTTKPSSAVTFAETANVDPATANASLTIVSGDGQTGIVGKQLSGALVFQAKDEFGNVVPNLGVSVQPIAGGAGVLGSTSTGGVTTDAQGKASFNATLGTKPGAYTFEAKLANGHFARFAASALVGPAVQLAITTQPPSSLPAATSFGLVAKLSDTYGNPVPGDSSSIVNATLAAGAHGTLLGTTSVTVLNGVATLSGLSYQVAETIHIVLALASGSQSPATSDPIVVTGSNTRIHFPGVSDSSGVLEVDPGESLLGITSSDFGSSTFLGATVQLTSQPNGAIVPLLFTGSTTMPSSFASLAASRLNVMALTAGDYVFHWDVHIASVSPGIFTTFDGHLSRDVTLRVRNLAPKVVAHAQQMVALGQDGFLDASATQDPNGDLMSLQWSVVDRTDVTIEDPKASKTVFHTTGAALGPVTFQLYASDAANNSAVSECVSVVMTSAMPPIAYAGLDQAIYVGATAALDASLSRGNNLAFEWSVVDPVTHQPLASQNGLADAASEQARFAPQALGMYVLAVKVTDDAGVSSTAYTTVTVIGADGSSPPQAVARVLSPIAGAIARLGDTVTLSGAQSGSTGVITSFTWRQSGGPPMQLGSLSGREVNFRPTLPGGYLFTLTVVDDAGLRSSDEVGFQVATAGGEAFAETVDATQGVHMAPTETPAVTLNRIHLNVAGARATVGTLVQLEDDITTASGGALAGGTALRYVWTQLQGAAVVLDGADTATPTFTPTERGLLVFRVLGYVQDAVPGTTDPAWIELPLTVALIVEDAADLAPNAKATVGGSQVVGFTTMIDATGSTDPQKQALTYTMIEVDSYPPVVIKQPSNGRFEFQNLVAGTYHFLLVATNAAGVPSDPVALTVVLTPATTTGGGGGGNTSGGGTGTKSDTPSVRGGGNGGGCTAAEAGGDAAAWLPIAALVLVLGVARRRAARAVAPARVVARRP